MKFKYSRKQILAFFPSYQSKADMLNDLLATKEQGELREDCPNCKDPDPEIEPCKDGSCGVCGGKGYIIWKEVGRIIEPTKPSTNYSREGIGGSESNESLVGKTSPQSVPPKKIGRFNLLEENVCDEACHCGWNLHIGGANYQDLDDIKNYLENKEDPTKPSTNAGSTCGSPTKKKIDRLASFEKNEAIINGIALTPYVTQLGGDQILNKLNEVIDHINSMQK